jgi:hypothetical protein
MDQLRGLLSVASWAPAPAPEPEPEPDRAEDIAIQQALDEVLEYHRTHRPKNTTKNYEPKQREWRVSPISLSYSLYPRLYIEINPFAYCSIGLV